MLRILLLTVSLLSMNRVINAQSSSKNSSYRNNDSLQLQILINEINGLKLQLQNQQQSGFATFSTAAFFIDAAIGSANNLQSLILKKSYRNKIASLNNPTSNELVFNLEMEIQNALKPLMAKAHKTNTSKFSQVVSTFMNTGKSTLSLFPAGNLFTSIVSMAGNLTVKEKSIDQQDLDSFIKSIEKYFNQYERLCQSNLVFNTDMEKLKIRLGLLQDDIKLLIQDLIIAMDKTQKREQLKYRSNEDLMLTYFDNKKMQEHFNKAGSFKILFPPDAIKTCKEIANNIKRINDDYSTVYNSNFKEIKSIISDTKKCRFGS